MRRDEQLYAVTQFLAEVKRQVAALPKPLTGTQRLEVVCELLTRDLDARHGRDQPPLPPDPPEPITKSMDQVASREVLWLWESVIPRGKLTLITGAPGVGKSLVALDIAARVSCGAAFPGVNCAPPMSGGTLLINAEDDLADTVRPRLEAAEADLANITTWQKVQEMCDLRGPRDRPQLVDIARDWGGLVREIANVFNCKLVVIDPVSAFLERGRGSKAERMSALLGRLAELAQETQVAIVATAIVTRPADNPLRRVPMDKLGLLAAARGAWSIIRDPRTEVRCMLPIKQNLWGPGGSLGFRITNDSEGRPRVEWDERAAERRIAGPITRVVMNLGVSPQPAEQTPAAPLLGFRPQAAPLVPAQEQLAALIRKRGGQITARELMRSSRHYQTAQRAQTALCELAAAGVVTRRLEPPKERGGRAVEVFEIGRNPGW